MENTLQEKKRAVNEGGKEGKRGERLEPKVFGLFFSIYVSLYHHDFGEFIIKQSVYLALLNLESFSYL